MKSRLFLDIVIRKCPAVFKLFTGKDETLLIRWDPFLILNFGLDVVDSVGRFDLKGDGLASY